jgi:hypothetical protein
VTSTGVPIQIDTGKLTAFGPATAGTRRQSQETIMTEISDPTFYRTPG